MFAYCCNCPIKLADYSGHSPESFIKDFFRRVKGVFFKATIVLSPSLLEYSAIELSELDKTSYNCLGNALGKQTDQYLPGYEDGMSSRQTYGLLCDLVGSNNIRELDSMDGPISDDEYRVAMRCGEDYHFIRQLSNGEWYNKSGLTTGLVIPSYYVEKGMDAEGYWHPISIEYWISEDKVYTDEIIYFALRKDWWRH